MVQVRLSCRLQETRTQLELSNYYVTDGPSSIVVSPSGNTYTVGTKLSASADSNPPANSYKWMDTKINDVLHTTSVLELTDSMVGEQLLQVEACNTLPDSPPTTLCNLAAFNFTVVTRKHCTVL